MWSIAKASFKTFIKNPSAIIFSLVFPFVFIILFGTQRNNVSTLDVIIDNQSTDTSFYHILRSHKMLKNVSKEYTLEEISERMSKGQISAILKIQDAPSHSSAPIVISISIPSVALGNGKYKMILDYLNAIVQEYDKKKFPENKTAVDILNPVVIDSRSVKAIDFILPGQLGFSLIASGIFGVAFSFFFMRKSGVLKRIFVTPISKTYILLGEGIARIFFQMLNAIIIIAVGYFFFDFTLINGLWTFVQLLMVCFLALVTFMNIGLLISNLAKNDQVIPALTNLVTIPQFLLAGTFFSISFFPSWLQSVSKVMPLTYVNDALRMIAFDGKNLWDVKIELGVLLLFSGLFFALNVKYFRWD